MKVNRKEFISKLSGLVPSLGKSDVFECFHFQDKFIRATNGVISTLVPFDSDDMQFSVPGKKFLKFLKSLKEEDVDFRVRRSNMRVSTDTVSADFVLSEVKDINISVPIENMTEVNDVKGLLDGLQICGAGASRDEGDKVLCGIYIDGDTLYSTDKFRIMKHDLGEDLGAQCIVPIDVVSAISGIRKIETIDIGCDGSLTLRINGSSIISACTLAGKYPDLSNFFPKGNGVEIKFVDDLCKVLSKHKSYQDTVDIGKQEVEFHISGDDCTLTSMSKDSGCLSEQVKLESAVDKNLNFFVNPIMFDGIDKGNRIIYYPSQGTLVVGLESCSCMIRLRE